MKVYIKQNLTAYLAAIVILLISIQVQAQDAHFSQFYNNPLYINPALTGTTDEARLMFNYRTQWPKLPGEFVTINASYDQHIEKANSNLGIIVSLDKAGSAGLRSTNINALYAYTLKISDEMAVQAGASVGYGQRLLNQFTLVFGDQLTPFGTTGQASQEPNLANQVGRYLDLSSGIVVYGRNFWAGIAGHHINQPNNAMSTLDQDAKLPMRLSAHMGLKIPFLESMTNRNVDYEGAVMPAIYYSQQGNFRQLDLGTNVYYHPITVGLWYRGLPIQESSNGAISVLVGFKYQKINFAYNYDLPVGRFAGITGGAHELSLSIKMGEYQGRRYSRRKQPLRFPSMMD
ncbi:PorP/SprF family type IX secretion system membrane protein [uncultured Microscilla sp.]|uniref:PorP/SprF family type IX secretion system membrane protein n=1 Tax=uncultured Microscilla sp. TaxID=432653 RepID=UPI002614D10A|nr:PorP/SprF family type IX secretion system membrane protein [uncultured Microscilla sp.]